MFTKLVLSLCTLLYNTFRLSTFRSRPTLKRTGWIECYNVYMLSLTHVMLCGLVREQEVWRYALVCLIC
jgi:hypothetical protein